jgi:predicted Zn-dependent protease
MTSVTNGIDDFLTLQTSMTPRFFETIGYRLGKKAAQARNAFDLMGGTEEDSLRAEIRLGRDLTAAFLERIPLAEENEITKFVTQIGNWLAGNVKERKVPFCVRVTAEPQANALALPGGPVFVSWPLLEMCQGERDAIAFLVGHEMAHIVLRHAVDKLIKDAAVSLLLRKASSRQAATTWLNNAGRQLLGRYSREVEFEADAYSFSLLRTAGGDPLIAEHFLKKLAQQSSVQSIGALGEYFSNHPPLLERISNLHARIQG